MKANCGIDAAQHLDLAQERNRNPLSAPNLQRRPQHRSQMAGQWRHHEPGPGETVRAQRGHIDQLEDDENQRSLIGLWIMSGGHTHRGFGTIAELTEALDRERFDL